MRTRIFKSLVVLAAVLTSSLLAAGCCDEACDQENDRRCCGGNLQVCDGETWQTTDCLELCGGDEASCDDVDPSCECI